ncbi:MAG: hypothetical protein ACTHJ7_07190 [Candidatus Nitrosocosmicus sp.]
MQTCYIPAKSNIYLVGKGRYDIETSAHGKILFVEISVHNKML